MLSALILALGIGAPAGFVVPTLTRPLLAAPRPAPLLTLRLTAPPEPRRPAREPVGAPGAVCTIRSIEAPPVDEGMARTFEPDVDPGMVVTSRCRAPLAARSPEPRR